MTADPEIQEMVAAAVSPTRTRTVESQGPKLAPSSVMVSPPTVAPFTLAPSGPQDISLVERNAEPSESFDVLDTLDPLVPRLTVQTTGVNEGEAYLKTYGRRLRVSVLLRELLRGCSVLRLHMRRDTSTLPTPAGAPRQAVAESDVHVLVAHAVSPMATSNSALALEHVRLVLGSSTPEGGFIFPKDRPSSVMPNRPRWLELEAGVRALITGASYVKAVVKRVVMFMPANLTSTSSEPASVPRDPYP